MSTPIQGSKLSPRLQARVLSMYVNRWTHENRHNVHPSVRPTMPPVSDQEWLASHAFYLTVTGDLDRRHHHAEPYYPEVQS